MICPDCGHDNVVGDDLCDACGQPLSNVAVSNELQEVISRHSVGVICEKQPVSVAVSSTVREAIDTMCSRKIGCLLVEDDGKLVGVFTERDVLNRISDDLSRLDRPISEFMTPSPETVTPDDSIAFAFHSMDLGGYRHIALVNDAHSATGIISVRDIMRFLCVRFAEIRT